MTLLVGIGHKDLPQFMDLKTRGLDHGNAKEEIVNYLERKREASQPQVSAMDTDEVLNSGWGEDETGGYWSMELKTEPPQTHHDHGLYAVMPGKGYKGVQKGKGGGKHHQNGLQNGWNHHDSKGLGQTDVKGKGKGKTKSFQGSC